MTEPLPLPLTVSVDEAHVNDDRVLILAPRIPGKAGRRVVLEVYDLFDGPKATAIAAHVAARLNVHPDMAETLRMVVREYFGSPETHNRQQKFIAERSLEILRSMAECIGPEPEPRLIHDGFGGVGTGGDEEFQGA